MTPGNGFISIRKVGKSFGAFRAIKDVSVDIRHGEFFSLLGPSGCGKTTLLRMLAGFEPTTEGDISIDGQSMESVPPNLRPINMVFQNYAIFPHLNVGDNIAYGLRKQRLPRPERQRLVEEMLELIKLPGFGDRKANELSGGQRQRVALARALIMRPKVLLLDEPLGALDKQLREQMQLELRNLQRSVGITFVFVTHDQEEALTLSDRIAVMSDGRVLQVDTPDRLYEAPRTRSVASFIGTMNFLDARVVEQTNGRARLDVAAVGECRVMAGAHTLAAGERVCVALRPEKITLHDRPPGDGTRTVEGTLETTVYLGERSHYHVRVPGCDHTLAVSAQNNELRAASGHAQGRPVWLSWHDEAAMILEAD